jgi:hypothetical protein
MQIRRSVLFHTSNKHVYVLREKNMKKITEDAIVTYTTYHQETFDPKSSVEMGARGRRIRLTPTTTEP